MLYYLCISSSDRKQEAPAKFEGRPRLWMTIWWNTNRCSKPQMHKWLKKLKIWLMASKLQLHYYLKTRIKIHNIISLIMVFSFSLLQIKLLLKPFNLFLDRFIIEIQSFWIASSKVNLDFLKNNFREHFRNESKLNRFTLMYRNFTLEKTFLLLPDPLFKYYITCCLITLILILLINGLTTNW